MITKTYALKIYRKTFNDVEDHVSFVSVEITPECRARWLRYQGIFELLKANDPGTVHVAVVDKTPCWISDAISEEYFASPEGRIFAHGLTHEIDTWRMVEIQPFMIGDLPKHTEVSVQSCTMYITEIGVSWAAVHPESLQTLGSALIPWSMLKEDAYTECLKTEEDVEQSVMTPEGIRSALLGGGLCTLFLIVIFLLLSR